MFCLSMFSHGPAIYIHIYEGLDGGSQKSLIVKIFAP